MLVKSGLSAARGGGHGLGKGGESQLLPGDWMSARATAGWEGASGPAGGVTRPCPPVSMSEAPGRSHGSKAESPEKLAGG